MSDAEGTFLDRAFGKIGGAVAARPKQSMLGAVFFAFVFCAGWSKKEDELRPEKQWVPTGAVAIDHKNYVDKVWPGQQRFNLYIATCHTTGSKEDCNMLESKYIKRLAEIDTKIKQMSADLDAGTIASMSAADQKIFTGGWTFDGHNNTNAKCFKFGDRCGQSSILDVFNANDISTLDDAGVLAAIKTHENLPAGFSAKPPVAMNTIAASSSAGPVRDANGDVISAWSLMGNYVLTRYDVKVTLDGRTRRKDPVAEIWEEKALCIMGIDTKNAGKSDACPEDDLIHFSALFQRSLGDEFGTAIRGDIALIASSYFIILIYMGIMLSKWDHTNSMIGMSLITLAIVGLSYGAGMGAGFWFGILNNPLTQNIPFLLLGLGVDDAFVLSSEFDMNRLRFPEETAEQAIRRTAMTGGVSILITSVTDALAFLVGSATVLPALSSFCVFAGMGVIFCYILQLFLFLPALLLNARRAEKGYLDCCCCMKSRHSAATVVDSEAGAAANTDGSAKATGGCICCPCVTTLTVADTQKQHADIASASVVERDMLIAAKTHGKLGLIMRKWGELITSKVGLAVTFTTFLVVLIVGVVGATKIYKDFKLEWFVPDDSYLNQFYRYNDANFASGTPFTVYLHSDKEALDVYQYREDLKWQHNYLTTSKYMDKHAGVTDWYHEFSKSAGHDESTSAAFYTSLKAWTNSPAGSRFANNLHWNDAGDATLGIKETRTQAKLSLAHTTTGQDRYTTMVEVRKALKPKFNGAAFPYSFQFLYWEEVGIIDSELTRNLIICGVVIFAIIGMLIPTPRVAIFVIASILLALVEMVGFMYWWGVTISGVSTIYILISVGLAVDYSAHIAHVFTHAYGTSTERAVGAVARIGPCVFNAVMSTILAVLVLSMSKSYIFRTFFKALCLVCIIGGAHGLWLLPALLAVFGGDKDSGDDGVIKTDKKVEQNAGLGAGKAASVAAGAEDEDDKDEMIASSAQMTV